MADAVALSRFQSHQNEVWIIVPTYNEARILPAVLAALLRICPNVVLVNDGSTDETDKVAARFPVHKLSHVINLGQGAALQTGMEWALNARARFLVTFDADGQMDENDIPDLCKPLFAGEADVTVGSRFLGKLSDDIPRLRKWILQVAARLTAIAGGPRLSDVHNGMRAFTREVASRIHLQQNGMAHASELLHEMKRLQVRIKEIPVHIQYSLYSLNKGQSNWNAVNILWDLLFKY